MHHAARMAAGLAVVLACAAATAAGPSASVVVSGAVDKPTVYTAARLAALPQVTQTDSTVAGTGGGHSDQFNVTGAVVNGRTFDLAALKALPSRTETVGGTTYVGVSLWDLLNATTGIVTDPAVKNDVLDKFVVATGSDGYQALISMGEIDPAFGNQPDLVAYQANGQLLDSNGFARLVVPGDAKAGRYVSNLVNLQVFAAPPAVPEPANPALLLAGLAGLGALTRGTRRRRARA